MKLQEISMALGGLAAVVGLAYARTMMSGSLAESSEDRRDQKIRDLWKRASDPSATPQELRRIEKQLEDLYAGGTGSGASTREYSQKMRYAREFGKLYGDR